MKARLGSPKAITAAAHKLARIFYHLWRHGKAYVEPGIDAYEQRYRERVLRNLQLKVHSLGLVLVSPPAPGSVS